MSASNFDLTELSYLNSSISYFLKTLYKQLEGYSHSDEKVKKWGEELKIDFYSQQDYGNWAKINIYCFTQWWGNTAGGWQGVGGDAMTENYTVGICNPDFKIIAIFYDGKFAYCVKANETSLQLLKDGRMPGFNFSDKLEVILKSNR